MKYILYFILFFYLFRFIRRFLLPLFYVTRQTGVHMRRMQEQMNNMQQKQQAPQPPRREKPRQVDGTYIDYEEVK